MGEHDRTEAGKARLDEGDVRPEEITTGSRIPRMASLSTRIGVAFTTEGG
jgi:hypothetical protein